MKNFKKKVLNSNNGITLIALVVTIIVLLILAGITLNIAIGNNGLIERVSNSKDENNHATVYEDVQLKAQEHYMDEAMGEGSESIIEYLRNEGVIDSDNVILTENLVGSHISTGNGTGTRDIYKILLASDIGESGEDYYVVYYGKDETIKILGKIEKTDKLDNSLIIAQIKPNSGETVTSLSETETIIVEDDLENEVPIPKGFGIAVDSGIKVEEGIVIEDAMDRTTKGSQFVWIPVGDINVSTTVDSSGKINIPLSRGLFDSTTGVFQSQQTQGGPNYKASTLSNLIANMYLEFKDDEESLAVRNTKYSNKKAANLAEYVESTLNNGGYYIARFEAGVNGTTSSNSATTYSIDGNTFTKNSAESGYLVTKAGVGVWNNISQINASAVCQEMYENINSDLMNSYAWDTALLFMQTCGTNKTYSNVTGDGTLRATGSGSDEQCKIYDMAENVGEITTETYIGLGGGNALRGAYWNGSTYRYHPKERTSGGYNSVYSKFGFRPILYF